MSCFLIRLYIGFSYFLTPIWRIALQYRLKKGKETQRSVDEKLVLHSAPRPQGLLVWGHAVGVGEALALAGLFAALSKRMPDHHFLLTTSAKTSALAIQKNPLPARCIHQFAPIDTPYTVRRFLQYWQPCLAIWCEMDLWPVTLNEVARNSIPMVLVNALLTPHKMTKKRWIKPILSQQLASFKTIYAQDMVTAQYLMRDLNVQSERVTVCGNIKVLAPELSCDQSELQYLRQRIDGRPCWLLASSHLGEERVALKAHAALLAQYPNALCIIAPRDQRRGEEIAGVCESEFNLSSALRSKGKHIEVNTQVYIADTIGELGLWYRLSPVSLVGGSLVAVGGHNPYEPIALGSMVLYGQYIENFASAYDGLKSTHTTQLVKDFYDIAHSVMGVWTTPPNRSNIQQAMQCAPAMMGLLDELSKLASSTKAA